MPSAASSLLLMAVAAVQGWNVPMPQTWSNRLGLTLTPISKGVWAAERKWKRFNAIDVGRRTVIARTSKGGLAVHGPCELDEPLKQGIEALGGDVTCIIGRGEKFDDDWKAAFPTAAYCTFDEAVMGSGDVTSSFYETNEKVKEAFEGMVVEGDAELGRKYGLGTSERVEGRLMSSLVIRPWMSPERLTLFFHEPSKTLLCGQAWWNWPMSSRPKFEGADGADGTGLVHECSKVPAEESVLPSVRAPFRTRAWATLKNRLLWPVRRSLLSQGGLNVGGWVLWTGGRPPGRAQRIYREQVMQVRAKRARQAGHTFLEYCS